MRKFLNLFGASAMVLAQLAAVAPAFAAPDYSGAKGRPAPQSRPAPQGRPAPQARPASQPKAYPKPSYPTGSKARPAGPNSTRPASAVSRPAPKPVDKSYNRPGNANRPGDVNRPGNDYRPGANNNRPGGNNNRPGGNNNRPGGNDININNNTNINVNNRPGGNYYRPPGNRPPGYYPPYQRPPGYRPPGYYPPPGGYYRPPRPPYGGWGGYYYPPPRYYYQDDFDAGDVFAGVLVAGTLIALLSAASNSSNNSTSSGPPPMYVAPPKSTGAPAAVRVDLGSMTPDARPSASTCLTEAARQIGATGGTEISIASIQDVEQGNGGYRFRMTLRAIYPDETRSIPMYCRATPEKIVELTFG